VAAGWEAWWLKSWQDKSLSKSLLQDTSLSEYNVVFNHPEASTMIKFDPRCPRA